MVTLISTACCLVGLEVKTLNPKSSHIKEKNHLKIVFISIRDDGC